MEYFSVTTEFGYNQYDTIDQALKSENCLLVIGWEVTNEPLKVENIQFINPLEKILDSKVRIKNWSAYIVKLRDNTAIYKIRADFRFIAPDGKVRSLDIGNYTGITNIIQSIKQLKFLSKFENWDQYDLVIENEKLKKENDLLRLEIQNLKKK